MTSPGGTQPRDAVSNGEAIRWSSLVRRIADGDAEAEAELATVFYPRVRLFASVRLGGADTASDIAQDTILAVLQALRQGRLHEPVTLPAFVLGTAHNLVNNHHRKVARSLEVPRDPPALPADVDQDWAYFEDERRAAVRKAVGRLNTVDRRILLLTLVEGLKPREIAPVVGLSPEVVRTRKARAVRAVAEEVARLTRKPPRRHLPSTGPE